ncbi:hypothetical protein SAMN04487928_104117 [Butyrivibrio proteoclasticus]|uniref:Uncharacterized protein n=1 Tax=Butyrivibrio proteoclasticus TaxID=43305 RepID=A0A1I5RNN6_9FIRM|nr:hypothetical protein [Butyrivibrio proteoclasticus]SFP60162.1 hypothetical protein SAMN04487928_104117 [Butyrivibrio proteoclasticus]
MSKSKNLPGAHVGSASILLIFTVLSLISFACLSLVNSRADYNLSNKLAERERIYYNACHQGNAFLAAVNSGYDYGLENGIIKESIQINDNQTLDITLSVNTVNNLSTSSNFYSIKQWQIVNHEDFEYDYSLPVKQN